MVKPTKILGEFSHFTFQIANNRGADKTARMRRLVCAFVAGKQKSQGSSWRGPYDVEAQASWLPPSYAPESIRLTVSV